MNLNYIAYYHSFDGYGRFNSRLIRALQGMGVQVKPATTTHIHMPTWMQEQEGIDWKNLTISSLPPYLISPVPGPHWILTMIEGSKAPQDWVDSLNESGAERILVPCQHNLEAYRSSGVTLPISILPGGTDPGEFPVIQEKKERPFTFLTLADRGFRKGWEEVWDAFYEAFGGKTTGVQDVRLMIKSLPKKEPTMVKFLEQAEDRDPRIILRTENSSDMREVYASADCLALPSHCEGWGMPHREAAMMGIPVITQRYSGLDDGYTDQWALTLEKGRIKPIPKGKILLGEWMVADVKELAGKMRWCYENQEDAREFALGASSWLSQNQTWNHSASRLIEYLDV